jgi:hypothetical protein
LSPVGVFCLEGDWDSDLRGRLSLRPVLELLERSMHARTIYRDVGTTAELEHYVGRWALRKYRDFNIGWLAFHGSPGRVHVGRRSVSLDDLSAMIGNGGLQGKTILFGSCSTMEDATAVADFRRRTGARAVCGYRRDGDWVEAAAFELLLLATFAEGWKQAAAPLRRVRAEYAGLAERLEFISDPDWR